MEAIVSKVMSEVDAAYERGRQMGRAEAVKDMADALLSMSRRGPAPKPLTVDAPAHVLGCRCEVCK